MFSGANLKTNFSYKQEINIGDIIKLKDELIRTIPDLCRFGKDCLLISMVPSSGEVKHIFSVMDCITGKRLINDLKGNSSFTLS